MPSPIMALAINRSMIAASDVPDATSIRASACDATELALYPSSSATASPADPASTANVSLDGSSSLDSSGATITCPLLQYALVHSIEFFTSSVSVIPFHTTSMFLDLSSMILLSQSISTNSTSTPRDSPTIFAISASKPTHSPESSL